MSYNLIDNAKMGRIVSVGDKIPCKIFGRIHSRFEHVLNFNLDGLIVSIVTNPIDAGPLRIVMDNVDLKTISEARLGHDDLKINNFLKYTRSTAKLYHSGWKPTGRVDTSAIKNNVIIMKNALMNNHHPSSLSSILLSESKQTNHSEFDKALIEQFKEAYTQLLDKNLNAAIPGFKGRGYGLTPSGDDFNTGLLLGFTSIQQCGNQEMPNIRSYVYSQALGKNQMVNTFLLQAYHGWYNDNWKRLLSAMTGETNEIETVFNDILAQGETSGADILTGFLTAWELELKG